MVSIQERLTFYSIFLSSVSVWYFAGKEMPKLDCKGLEQQVKLLYIAAPPRLKLTLLW